MSNPRRVKLKIDLTTVREIQDLTFLYTEEDLFRFLDNITDDLKTKRKIQNEYRDLIPGFARWLASRRPYESRVYAYSTRAYSKPGPLKLYRVIAVRIDNTEVHGFKKLVANFSWV